MGEGKKDCSPVSKDLGYRGKIHQGEIFRKRYFLSGSP